MAACAADHSASAASDRAIGSGGITTRLKAKVGMPSGEAEATSQPVIGSATSAP